MPRTTARTGAWVVRLKPHELCPQHKTTVSFSSANLPPTLAKSQVSSVRKNLKLHLLNVLKHPASLEFQAQITTLLVDLGTPQAEIARNMPNSKEARKRPREDSDSTLKKMKLGELRRRVWPSRSGGQGLATFKVFIYMKPKALLILILCCKLRCVNAT